MRPNIGLNDPGPLSITVMQDRASKVLNEPRHEKTCLRGLQPGKTQTGLLSYRSKLESQNFGDSKLRYYTIQAVNNKGADQCVRTQPYYLQSSVSVSELFTVQCLSICIVYSPVSQYLNYLQSSVSASTSFTAQCHSICIVYSPVSQHLHQLQPNVTVSELFTVPCLSICIIHSTMSQYLHCLRSCV